MSQVFFGLIYRLNYTDYVATKFAVTGFTAALMAEFHTSPISIHCVHPGGIAPSIAKTAASAAFAQKYLRTPPEHIARYVIKCIQRQQPTIVYGTRAWQAWFGAHFLPTRLRKALLWHEMKAVIDTTGYQAFIRPDMSQK